ncbi:MAG: hypothetical protein JWO94_718 [Verrucomicrobiaceae bacterium]|nr:hypothetical protein [Verrucomicrobiaceae bacterium]
MPTLFNSRLSMPAAAATLAPMISRSLLCLFMASALTQAAQPGRPSKAESKTPKLGEWSQITLKESPPPSDPEQLKSRMHAAENPGAYDVTRETFSILVPKGYRKEVPYGLFVWVSPSANASIPKEWEAVLAEKKLIFIGAHNSGNPRDVFDRMRMAVDANHNLRGMFNVDDQRVYVSGFSGGSRVASMLGVCYADMFTGAICFMGVNFYEPVLGEDKMMYQARYIPNEEILGIAKKECRFVFLTGEKDFNLADTKAVHAAALKGGFQAVEFYNIPNQGHQPPAAEWLRRSLDYLDQGKGETKAGGLPVKNS